MSDYKPRIQIVGVGPWACQLLGRFQPTGGLECLAIFPSTSNCPTTRQIILPDWIPHPCRDEEIGRQASLDKSEAIIEELAERGLSVLLADLGDPFTRGCLPLICLAVAELRLVCPLVYRGTGGPDESLVLKQVRDESSCSMPIVPVCPSEQNDLEGLGAEELMLPIALGLAELFRIRGEAAARDVFETLDLARLACATGHDLAALAEKSGRLIAGSKKPDFALVIACMHPAFEVELEDIPFLLGEYLPESGFYFQAWLPREKPDKRLLIVGADVRDLANEPHSKETERDWKSLAIQSPEPPQPAADPGSTARYESDGWTERELDQPAYLRRRAPERHPDWDHLDRHPMSYPEPGSRSADVSERPTPFPDFLRRPTPPDVAEARQEDEVDCSVFSPEEVRCGEALLIQAFIHLPAKAYEADRLAREFDSDAVRRGFSALVPVPLGEVVSLHLRLPGAEIVEANQSLRWSGRTAAACFELAIPQSCSAAALIGRVTIARQTVPIGHVSFKLRVVSKASEREPSQTPRRVGAAHKYRSAFVSYASEDRPEVMKRIQMLAPLGITFFYDVLSLDPGQRWESELYRHIEKSDVFFLFWSQAARRSEWVQKEVAYAMTLKGNDDEAPPEIMPITLEGPPIPEPPDRLKHLHFSDRTLFFKV